MSVPYLLVYCVLILEVIVISIILAPIPSRWRQKLLLSTSKDLIVGDEETRMLRLSNPTTLDKIKKSIQTFMSAMATNLKYARRMVLVFIAVLFIDSIKTAQKARLDLDSKEEKVEGASINIRDSMHDSQKLTKMFYAQRNIYLTGMTLFLSVVLDRLIHVLVLEMTNAASNGSAKSGAVETDDFFSKRTGSFRSSMSQSPLIGKSSSELPIASSPTATTSNESIIAANKKRD